MTMTPYQRAGRWYTNKMLPFLAPQMIARNLFGNVIRLPEGKVEMEFDRISQMKDATVQLTLPDETLKRDLIGLTNDTLRAPYIVNGFKITQDQLRTFNSEGKDLPTSGIKEMSRTIATKDQGLLIDSYTAEGQTFKGLYASATTIDNTAYDFSTPGKASQGTAEIVGMLREASVVGCNFNMLIPESKLTTLKNSWIVGSGTGIWEIEKVIKNLNPIDGAAPGRIYGSPFAKTDKAIISPCDPSGMYTSLVIGYDPRVITGYNPILTEEFSPVYVTGFECAVPWIEYPESIGVLSSI
jgi:hypothetical protein